MSAQTPDHEYLSFFCSEFASILHSGISVSEGFALIAVKEPNPYIRQMLTTLCDRTDTGMSVHEAMRETGVFPPYMMQLVQIGETAGMMETVFRSLAAYYDNRIKIKRTIKSAVAYPSILLVVMLLVIFVFLTEVLPIFSDVYSQLGASMSAGSAAFLRLGISLSNAKWFMLAIILLLVAVALTIRFVPSWRAGFSHWITKRLYRTKLGKKISMSRFASALSLAYSGVSDIDEALTMSQIFCADEDMNRRITLCREEIDAGTNLSDAVTKYSLLDPLYCRMLTIGVRTGTTESTLQEIASRTESDMSISIDSATSRIEPAIVIILSLCVGLLLLGVMLPLVGIMSVI